MRDLQASFAEAAPVEKKGGCALQHPVELSFASRHIRIEPPAVLDCQTALVVARFFGTDRIAPKHFRAAIKTVHNASGYVCRPIGGGRNLSEHAFGRALDISGFTLSDGRQIAVQQHGRGQGPEAKFLRDIREAACGPFSTVLGPGTDAAHADHFHFDTKKRRAPYCR